MTEAAAFVGDEMFVARCAGGFRGHGGMQVHVSRNDARRAAVAFAGDCGWHGTIGEIPGQMPVCARRRAALCGRGAIAPQRFVQRQAAQHASAQAWPDDADIGGSAEPAGPTPAEFRCLGTERGDEGLAVCDEIGNEDGKGGESVEGCGSAGPSPR